METTGNVTGVATSTVLRPAPGPSHPPSRPAQESGLARLAGWCHDHRWWVVALWLVGLVAFNFAAHATGSAFTNNLNGGAQPVQQILNQAFPGQSGSQNQVVITAAGSITAPAVEARTAR